MSTRKSRRREWIYNMKCAYSRALWKFGVDDPPWKKLADLTPITFTWGRSGSCSQVGYLTVDEKGTGEDDVDR